MNNLAILATNFRYHHTNHRKAVKKIHKRQKRQLYQAESLMVQPLVYPKTSNAAPAPGTAAS
jgi:hypothetical protein